jgi:dihydrofolate reductase
MKVILYMAISTDGYIAKENDDTSWITAEEWNSYSAAIQNAGNLIVGHRTYDILTKQPEFSELKDIRLVAVSHQDFDTIADNHSVVHSPKEALEQLKSFEEVILAGGGDLNGSFLKENLIDEIYLDIEPIVLGKGIKLFENGGTEVKLELLETKKITDNEIQLHYKVLK